MKIWALADLHLSISTPEKTMEAFGPVWNEYHRKIEKRWKEVVGKDDLVIIAGDVSWASTLEKARIDFEWIDKLPGTKLISKGNHDRYWSSEKKMGVFDFKTIHFLYNAPFVWKGIGFAGTRLWDSEEYRFDEYIEFRENPRARKETQSIEEKRAHNREIFERELLRLKRNIKELPDGLSYRIAVMHYPPIGAELESSKASKILEDAKIDIAIFGHLHSLKEGSLNFGTLRGVKYLLTSADYLNFHPKLILDL